MHKSKKIEDAKNKLINLGCEIININQRGSKTPVWYIDYLYDELKYSKSIYSILKYDMDSLIKSSLDYKNPYCVENANILGDKDNPYNSHIIDKMQGDNKQGTMCKYICGICGNIENRRIYEYIRSPFKVCENCRKNLHTTKFDNEKEVFNDIENNYNFKILPNQHYNGAHEKIGIIDENGYKGEICYINIKNGAKISPFAKYNTYALENLRYYIKKNGIDCIIPNQKYKGWDLPLKVKCSCGKIFKTTLTHFMVDCQYQCQDCSSAKSNNEKIIELWLVKHNIKFTTQYKFDDCYYKKALPFDFYINDTNILIEVDGEQHFKPIGFGEKNKKKINKNFNDIQKRDKIKTNFCKTYGYNLIRIPYTEIDNGNYEDILSQLFIKE